MIIDAFKKLDANKMKKFLSYYTNGEEKCYIIFEDKDSNNCEIDIKNLRNFFENSFEANKEEFKKFKIDKQANIFIVKDENNALQISYVDLAWWSAKKKRLDELFNGQEKSQVKTSIQEIKIEVCTIKLDENQQPIPNDIKTFEGSKKDAVYFINYEYQIRKVKTFFDNDVMFKIDNGKWKTFEELLKEGILK